LPCESVGKAEGVSALEVAAKDDPAPEGGAMGNTTPEGARPGSSSAASMDIHVGSPLVQSKELVVTDLAAALVGPVTLEASDPDARNLLPADGADAPSTSSASMLPALGLPLFLQSLGESTFASYCSC
jgi:hypothetical protein